MLTKEQRDLAEQLRNLITDAQCDEDPDVEDLHSLLGRCVARFDEN